MTTTIFDYVTGERLPQGCIKVATCIHLVNLLKYNHHIKKGTSLILGKYDRAKCNHSGHTHKPLHLSTNEELHHLCCVNHSSYCCGVLSPRSNLAV